MMKASSAEPAEGGGEGMPGGSAMGMGGGEEAAAQAKQQQDNARKQDEAKNSILSQVLTQDARARLSTIAVAKPEKARQLEHQIINMARFGQIRDKLDDEGLKSLLDRIAEHTAPAKTTVKFDRRRAAIDSDSD